RGLKCQKSIGEVSLTSDSLSFWTICSESGRTNRGRADTGGRYSVSRAMDDSAQHLPRCEPEFSDISIRGRGCKSLTVFAFDKFSQRRIIISLLCAADSATQRLSSLLQPRRSVSTSLRTQSRDGEFLQRFRLVSRCCTTAYRGLGGK